MIATMMETTLSARVPSPIGMLTLTSNGSALTQLLITYHMVKATTDERVV